MKKATVSLWSAKKSSKKRKSTKAAWNSSKKAKTMKTSSVKALTASVKTNCPTKNLNNQAKLTKKPQKKTTSELTSQLPSKWQN